MNRRTILAAAAPALLALAELRNPAGADPVKSGTCGYCKNQGDCLHGLVCADHVCGPPSLLCGGHLYTCGRHKQFVCRDDAKALCVPKKKSSDRKTTKARHLCKDGGSVSPAANPIPAGTKVEG